MKTYLGSIFDACAAVMIVFGVIAAPAFGVFLLLSTQDFLSVYFLVMGLLCSLWFVFCIKRYARKMYAWGRFDNEKIQVKGFFFKPYFLEYKKIFSIEIAGYAHGITKASSSWVQWYICLSYDKFDSQYRNRLNLWEINDRRVKVRYSPKLCQFLLKILPQPQADMLLKSLKASGWLEANPKSR